MKDDYVATFDALDLDAATIAIGHGETITPDAVRESVTDPMETLPRIKLDQRTVTGSDADFRIVDTLGEGGMGIVSLAEQTALRRLVAVKEPKGEGARAANRVLDEAFVMGRVEHPNVVPAYSLGRRENGRPVLAMKRVEGTSWDDVIKGETQAPGGGEVDLVWHLRVLLQVCNAVRFAHARRVVHRDIKPENVMIGEFGEVYLLDWGIALSIDPEIEEGFPSIANAKGLAGTPAFMAPEMTGDDASDIDERTDVYLLGANLHMVLTGRPPHAGTSLFAVCMAAFQSKPPEYGEDVPSDLAAIATRAMAREKDDRFDDVGTFATAVSDYLEHRSSYTLSDAAWTTLNAVVEQNDPEVDTANQLLEAEFGFRQALTIWSGNARARAGLQAAVEHRVRTCVAREELGGARAAYAQLPQANAELEQEIGRLADALETRAERVDYLEKFEQDLDLRTGTRSRQRTVIFLGLAFTGLCLWQAYTARPGQPPAETEAWLTTFWRLLVIAGVCLALYWKKLMANVANRRIVAFFISALVAMFLLRYAAVQFQAPPMYLQVAETVLIGLAAFSIGVGSSRRLAFAAAVVYPAAVLAGIAGGEIWIALVALGVAHLAFFGFMAWLWRPSSTRS